MARKEDVVRNAVKLMSNTANIRNIGIAAHIDHGKCVAPHTRLQLADGSFKTAEQLFQQASLNGEKVRENENETVFELRQPMKVFSVDAHCGKVVEKNISHAWKLKGGITKEIKLNNGASVATTPEHKFLIFDGM